jgi:ferredoxin-thioredoxin reductase catalytic chain
VGPAGRIEESATALAVTLHSPRSHAPRPSLRLTSPAPSRYHLHTMASDDHADDQQRARARVEGMVRRYVARGPYYLNPDPVTVEHVLAGLTRNLLRHGRAYCPCREVSGEPARDRLNICPCPQHRADIARDGVCECGIFASADYAAANPVVLEPKGPG